MLRLIDANLDRLGEGLRVLEDVARFLLNDLEITEELKALRHKMVISDSDIRSRLLVSRDSGNDAMKGRVEGKRGNVIDLVTANAKRAQEALRVLEEFAKLPQIPLKVRQKDFAQARFTLYEIEKELTLKLQRQDKRERIAGLYVIIDTETLGGRGEVEAARQAIQGGAKIIQFRDKHRGKRDLFPIAQELKGICTETTTLFILNDYLDLTLATNADGVHLGQGDLPIHLVREILPPDKIIGCSVRTVEQTLQAQEEGTDYIGVGSIYPSPTKPDAEVIGLERLREIKNAISLPVVALGGINESNVEEVVKAGADAVAVISAVLNTEDVATSARRLAAKMRKEVIIGKADF